MRKQNNDTKTDGLPTPTGIDIYLSTASVHLCDGIGDRGVIGVIGDIGINASLLVPVFPTAFVDWMVDIDAVIILFS